MAPASGTGFKSVRTRQRFEAPHVPGRVTVWAGPLWIDGEPREGWARVEKGRVVDTGEGAPHGARAATILSGLFNYHTHIGDAFLAGRQLPHDLDALVRPGSGFKHRQLAAASPATIQTGIRRALQKYGDAGTAALLDFREQGVAGLRMARQAQRVYGADLPALRLFGRPARVPLQGDELETVVEAADGLGVPSLTDVGPIAYGEITSAARRAKKPVAVHVSESRREDVATVLAGRPQLLVHLCRAIAPDFKQILDAGVAVAVCPSSNAFFRLKAPVRALHRAGIPFHLGTDNAMLGSFDLLHEAARAKRLAPEVPDAVLLRGLTTPPEKVINRIQAVPARTASRAPLVILPRRGRRVPWGATPVVAVR
jgi:cytosine/adenosine deaminase-related metal-dependent hydrolase